MKMEFEDDCLKPKSDSPALSVPSTAATSYGSSPESIETDESNPISHDASKHDSVRRNLFKLSNGGDSPKVITSPSSPDPILVGRGISQSPGADENGGIDTISITSSQTTAIPVWNLSVKDAAEKNVEVPLEKFILSQPISLLHSSVSFASDQTQSPTTSTSSSPISRQNYPLDESESRGTNQVEPNSNPQPSIVIEDPPEQPTACNASINLTSASAQITDMFLALGQSARQRYKGSDQTEKLNPRTPPAIKVVDEYTPEYSLIRSPPPIPKSRNLSESSFESDKSDKSQVSFEISKILSLERELGDLKLSRERDALTITHLRQEVETQKQLNSLKEVEIGDKENEARLLEYRNRELTETIQILKNELDKITSLKSAPSDELDQLALHPVALSNSPAVNHFVPKNDYVELFSAKLPDRVHGPEISRRNDIYNEGSLVTNYGTKERVQNNQNDNSKEISTLQGTNSQTHPPSTLEVESLLKDIVKRLEVMEKEKEIKESPLGPEMKEQENKRIETGHNGVRLNISDDPIAIEAMSVKQNKEICMDPKGQSNWCCDWSIVSGQ